MHPPLSLSLTHTHAPILSLRHTHAPARMQARTHAHTHTPSRTPFLREVTERSERGSLVWLFDRPFPVWSEKNSTKVAPTRGPLSQPPSLSLSLPLSLSSIDGASSFSKEADSFFFFFFLWAAASVGAAAAAAAAFHFGGLFFPVIGIAHSLLTHPWTPRKNFWHTLPHTHARTRTHAHMVELHPFACIATTPQTTTFISFSSPTDSPSKMYPYIF